MSTAIAYNNSYADLAEKQEGTIGKVQRYWKLMQRYDGLFSSVHARLLLGITKQRFHQISDRLETVPLKEFEGHVLYTGRGLEQYRKEAMERRPRGPAKEK